MMRGRSEADATHVSARSTAADPDLVKLTCSQRDRDDEAERFEQLLPEVVVEPGRDTAERRQLPGNRLGHAWMVVTEEHGAATRREIKVLTILVVPHVRPVTPHEAQVARSATQFIEPTIWKYRGHPRNLRYVR